MKWWGIAAGGAVLAISAALIVLLIIPHREMPVTAVAKITIELGPDYYAIGVDDYANFDLSSFAGLAEAQCISREYCSVRIWRERDMTYAPSLRRAQIRSQLLPSRPIRIKHGSVLTAASIARSQAVCAWVF